MSAYIVFMRTKTIDQKELDKYRAGIKATMKGHPIEVLAADAKDWINSEAYQDIAKHRKLGATNHGLIVEGLS